MPKLKKNKQKIDPSIWVILIGGLMLLVAVIVLFTQSRQSAQTPTQNANIPFPEVERVSVQDAKTAFDAGTAVFVDVRGDELYNTGHIPGALSIADTEMDSRFTELDPNAWIITYCT